MGKKWEEKSLGRAAGKEAKRGRQTGESTTTRGRGKEMKGEVSGLQYPGENSFASGGNPEKLKSRGEGDVFRSFW